MIRWECNRCSKVFRSERSLDQHLMATYCGKPRCSVCSKDFSNSSGLAAHQKAKDHYTIDELKDTIAELNDTIAETTAELNAKLHAKDRYIVDELCKKTNENTMLTREINKMSELVEFKILTAKLVEVQLSDVFRWDMKRNKGRLQALFHSKVIQLFSTNKDVNDLYSFEVTTIFWRIEVFSDSKTHTSDGHWVAEFVKGFLCFNEMLATRYSTTS